MTDPLTPQDEVRQQTDEEAGLQSPEERERLEGEQTEVDEDEAEDGEEDAEES